MTLLTDVDILIPTCGRPAALAATLAGLAGQTATGFRVVVSDQSAGAPSYADPAVQGVLRVLAHRGCRVETGRHLPVRGIAEHRAHLLGCARTPYALFLDDDVLLDPPVLYRLREAIETLGAGFVGASIQGLSFLDDERPHEHEPLELWPGRVLPERVRKGDRAWERWRLHNAANLVHVERRLRAEGAFADREWLAYRVCWVAGCWLFDVAALRAVGGFDFWAELPAGHAGEDVVAQLRLLERYGGAGLLPSGAWHLEAPTTVTDRRADAYGAVLEPGLRR